MRLTAAPAVVGVVLTAALATGCSDDDPPDADPSNSPSTSASPTESAEPAVAPADGKRWRPTHPRRTLTRLEHTPCGTSLAVQVFAFSPDALTFVAISDGSAVNDDSLDERAQEVERSYGSTAPEGGGAGHDRCVEAYRVAGDVGNGSHIIEVGTITGGQDVYLRLETFNVSPGVAADPRLGPGELAVFLTRTRAPARHPSDARGLALGCGGDDSPDAVHADPATTSASASRRSPPPRARSPRSGQSCRGRRSRTRAAGLEGRAGGASAAALDPVRRRGGGGRRTSPGFLSIAGRIGVPRRAAAQARQGAGVLEPATRSRRRSWRPSTSPA